MTEEALRAELGEFRLAMDKGFDRCTEAIAKSEEKWRERTHELASMAQTQAIALALQDQRIQVIERAAAVAKEDRRWMWGAVISSAGLIGGIVSWFTEIVRHKP